MTAKKWKVVASDYNSPFFRNYIWVSCGFKYPSCLGISTFDIGIMSKKNTISYIADMVSWEKRHNELKRKVEEKNKFILEIIEKTNKLGEEFNKWSEENIMNASLEKCSGKELLSLLYKFIDQQSTLYTYGIALPILDFQEFSFIEGNLQKFLKERGGDKYQEYYQVFTHPAHNSFAQDQEEDLLRLMAEFYNSPNWKSEMQTLSLTEIKKKYPSFFSKLEKHTHKYCWVYYVYAGPAYNEQQFLDFMKEYIRKGVEPQKKIDAIAAEKKKIQKLKKEYLKELNPNTFQTFILDMAGIIVWAKPRRKDYQSKSYYHAEKLLAEIGKRLSLSLEEVRSAPPAVLEKALVEATLDKNMIKNVFEFHICVPENGKVRVLTGKEAEEFYENNIEKEKEEKVRTRQELKGACACTGSAKGRVKIINVPDEMKKMKHGDILVSTATTPSIVPVMKMAAAIVTDEGGLTCHAAIVSRELQIPCVVGTKVATKVLKEGDYVHVDATKGIITKIDKETSK